MKKIILKDSGGLSDCRRLSKLDMLSRCEWISLCCLYRISNPLWLIYIYMYMYSGTYMVTKMKYRLYSQPICLLDNIEAYGLLPRRSANPRWLKWIQIQLFGIWRCYLLKLKMFVWCLSHELRQCLYMYVILIIIIIIIYVYTHFIHQVQMILYHYAILIDTLVSIFHSRRYFSTGYPWNSVKQTGNFQCPIEDDIVNCELFQYAKIFHR